MQMFDHPETEGLLCHSSLAALRSVGHQPLASILELVEYICSPFKTKVGDQVGKMKKKIFKESCMETEGMNCRKKGWAEQFPLLWEFAPDQTAGVLCSEMGARVLWLLTGKERCVGAVEVIEVTIPHIFSRKEGIFLAMRGGGHGGVCSSFLKYRLVFSKCLTFPTIINKIRKVATNVTEALKHEYLSFHHFL